MTTLVCTVCGQRIHGQPSGTNCLVCGSRTADEQQPKPRPRIDRDRFRARRDTCRKCRFFGTWIRNNKSFDGCSHLEKPCDVEQLWMLDDPNWCPVGKHSPKDFKTDVARVAIDFDEDEIPTPSHSRAIVTIAAGSHAMECRQITRTRVAEYATRVGADLVELSGDKLPAWPMGNKFRLHSVAKKYRRTLYLDCDIIIKRDAPNIFEAVPPHQVAVYDELDDTRGTTDWAQWQTNAVAESQEIQPHELPWSANGGVILLPQHWADIYKPPTEPLPVYWCADQQLLTLRVLESGAQPHLLHHKWNCIRNAPTFAEREPASHFIHANATNGSNRLRLLEQWDQNR